RRRPVTKPSPPGAPTRRSSGPPAPSIRGRGAALFLHVEAHQRFHQPFVGAGACGSSPPEARESEGLRHLAGRRASCCGRWAFYTCWETSSEDAPMKRIFIITAAVVALGCGLAACESPTPFQAATPGGHGYSDFRIDAMRWRVNFSGNSLTSRETVE